MAVRVTLRNNRKQRKVWIDNDAMKFLPAEIAKKLNQDEIRVVNFVGEHGKINVSECHRLLTHIKTWHTARKLLIKLAQKEILEYFHRDDIGRDPDACFKLKARLNSSGK